MSLVERAKTEILNLVNDALLAFEDIDEQAWLYKPAPGRWSRKEVLGHLADSASNNLRRFVVAQYEQRTKVVYDQDEWVRLQDYQHMDLDALVMLWKLLNSQLVRVLELMPQHKLDNTCDTGKGKVEVHSLVYFIEDYIVHLGYHLKQIKDPNFNLHKEK